MTEFGSPGPAPPLVSVVVRTIGRASLKRALASVLAQTYRPLEIVLVDAAHRGLEMVEYGGIPVHIVNRGSPLNRPRAANAGLEAAHGQWLTFLDEDDEIESDHVALLVATATVAGLPVAYSQTQVVAPPAKPRLLGGPFNRAALLRSNYLTMNAVLFHRALLAQGCRFDESLETLEDWDFWLQLSSRVEFAFTGKPTAIYHAGGGESGAGGDGNLDREAMLAQRARLMRKWEERS